MVNTIIRSGTQKYWSLLKWTNRTGVRITMSVKIADQMNGLR